MEEPLRKLVDGTYILPLEFITEVTWVKDYLKDNYEKDAQLVLNGIRKDIYSSLGDSIAPREDGKLRVLVEGHLGVFFKNVEKTIELCKQSKADEIWLLTGSNITEYNGINKVFSKIPIFETPKIYRSCDVVIKLSYVEGMFGPPLEMFHCGGTAIVYDVTGYDEYIRHNENAFVVKTDDENQVVEYINLLKEDSSILKRLKAGATKTANKWPDWETQSIRFENTLKKIDNKTPDITRELLEKTMKYIFNFYEIAERYKLQIKNCIS